MTFTKTIPKTQFKAQALSYLRQVEKTKTPLVVTHFGQPVVKILPISKKESPKKTLQGTLLKFSEPTKPTGAVWKSLQ